MQLLLGAQALFLLGVLGSAFHRITGAGTGASLLIGGFGGFLVIFFIYRKFPKSVLVLAAGAWGTGGYMLGNTIIFSDANPLILAVIGAAIGFGINAAWLAELDRSYAKGQAFADSVLPEIISQKDREGLVLLWHALRRLDGMKVIDESTFKRLNGDIAGLLKMPNPPEGSAPMRINDVADGFEAVRLMQDNRMIGVAEADAIRARIEERENERRHVPMTEEARKPQSRAPMGLNADGSLSESERQILAAYLPKLVENRALSPVTFARVMGVLEPSSVERNLANIEFPYDDSADSDDLETVERLHKVGLIDAAEYRRGLQVILPYLHTVKT